MGIPDPVNGSAPRISLCPLAPAHLIGLGALQAAGVLLLIEPWWALWPLVGYVVLMGVAAFFPGWRLFMPVVQRGRLPGAVGLTFDDGPDPATTEALLDLLARHDAKAAFFLVGERAAAYPELVGRILDAGHEIGNHTQDHDVLLALRGRRRVRKTIAACQATLASAGVRPRVFRPPAWVVNPGLWRVLLEHDLICVTASRRGLDFGNRRLAGLAKRVLARVRSGDLIALHDRAPVADQTTEAWLVEVEAILNGLAERGLQVAPLSANLGRAVMEPADGNDPIDGNDGGLGAVRWFYDGLAANYDAEQEGRGQGGVRAAESAVVADGTSSLVPEGGRVLELGAGTGRFTLDLARRAASVVAVDLSAAMLAVLDAKARDQDLNNIQTLVGDLHRLDLEPDFDLVCSFSVLEYAPDLEGAIGILARKLRPGGRLWLTTAHAGVPRLIGQIGNAMRQGIWLHARTRGQVRRALERAGLGLDRVRSFGPGGVLLEACATRPAQTPLSGAAGPAA